MKTNQTRLQPHGFTLIEMMATVALVGILAGIMVSYGAAGKRDRDFDAAAQALITAVGIARGNAVATGTISTVALPGDAIVAFEDKDGDSAFTPGTDTLLFRYPAALGSTLPAGLTVALRGRPVTRASNKTLEFDGRGYMMWSNHETSAYYTITMRGDARVCVQDAVSGRKKRLYVSGVGWAGFFEDGPCP